MNDRRLMLHVAHSRRSLALKSAGVRLAGFAIAVLLAAPPSSWAQSAPVAPARAAPAPSAPPAKAPAAAAAPAAPAERSAAGGTALPAPGPGATDTRGLDQDIQGLKKDVVDLNRDLFVLEEELLFPANTQVAVFLSVDVGDMFLLDTVTLKIDQKEVANYLYTPREVEALARGGVHRLYLGNLKAGQHELAAFFRGKAPHDVATPRG